MTTAPSSRGLAGSRLLMRAGALTLALGGVAVIVAALVAGSAAAAGAAVGLVLVLVVFGGGALLVDLVAGVLPTASLLIALLTYTLQVVLMGLVFLVLTRSGTLDSALDRAWLGGAVIIGTFTWLVCQVILATRARIPAFAIDEAGAR